jgi:Bacterial membrane protein YfhO
MSETAWPDGYWRDARWLAMCLSALLLLAFSPFLVGPFTLLASASDAPSLYATGAAPEPAPVRPLKELDPGGADWQSEAWLQIEHDALFVDHRIPWWDPYDGYGHPFAAAQPQQPFYPLTLLAAVHPSPRVWDAYVVARLFVAGIFAGLFVLFYGGRFGALAAALATSFSGYYLLYYAMPHLSVETLFPAMLWGTEWLVRRPGLKPAAVLGIVIGMLHLGGMPESTAVAVGAAFLYLLLRVRTSAPATLPFARIAIFLGANVLGAGIGAIMLIPFLEFLPQAFDTHRTTGAPFGLGYDPISLSRAWLQRLAPLSYGPPWNSLVEASGNGFSGLRGWFGAAVAAGALIALFDAARPVRERLRTAGPTVALSVLALGALAKSIGAPWINWIGVLPVLRLIIFPKYTEVIIDVSVAILCGLGIAAFERSIRPKPWVSIAAVASVAFALTLGFRDALGAITPTARVTFLYFSVGVAAASLLAVLAIVRLRRAQTYAAALLVSVVCLEVIGNYYAPMYAHFANVPRASRNPYAGAPYVTAVRGMNHDALRVLGIGGPLWPSWSGAMRLDDPAALDAVTPRRYFTFLTAFLKQRNPAAVDDLVNRFDTTSDPSFTTPAAKRWMTLSSIGFLITSKDRVIDDPAISKVYDGDVRIYAYDDPLPRAAIFHRARLAANDEEALHILADRRTDVHTTLVISDQRFDPSILQPSSKSTAGESAAIAHRDVASATLDVNLRRPGLVMLTDTYFPGWIATVDGSATSILRANYLFRAVRVAGGHHRVEFTYRSSAVAYGVAVTILSLAIAAFLMWLACRLPRSGYLTTNETAVFEG